MGHNIALFEGFTSKSYMALPKNATKLPFRTYQGLFFFLMMASIFNAFAVTIFACSYDLRKNLAYNEYLSQTRTDVFILG